MTRVEWHVMPFDVSDAPRCLKAGSFLVKRLLLWVLSSVRNVYPRSSVLVIPWYLINRVITQSSNLFICPRLWRSVFLDEINLHRLTTLSNPLVNLLHGVCVQWSESISVSHSESVLRNTVGIVSPYPKKNPANTSTQRVHVLSSCTLSVYSYIYRCGTLNKLVPVLTEFCYFWSI